MGICTHGLIDIEGQIYSRVDHAMGNTNWFLKYEQCVIEILPPFISYHCTNRIGLDYPVIRRNDPFKFLNYLVEYEDFLEKVESVRKKTSCRGSRMFVLWTNS